MDEKTLSAIKQLAKKYSIVNVDGNVTFNMSEDIKRDGKVIDRPQVRIPLEKLEAITSKDTDEESIITEIKQSVDIIG